MLLPRNISGVVCACKKSIRASCVGFGLVIFCSLNEHQCTRCSTANDLSRYILSEAGLSPPGQYHSRQPEKIVHTRNKASRDRIVCVVLSTPHIQAFEPYSLLMLPRDCRRIAPVSSYQTCFSAVSINMTALVVLPFGRWLDRMLA